MKHVVLYTALILLFAAPLSPAAAQERNTHYQAAIDLTNLSQKDSYSSLINTMIDIQAKQMPVEQQSTYRAAMTEFMETYMSWPVMKDIYAKIYMAQFTEQELKDIIVFYQSSSGAKLMARTPDIFQLGAAAGQNLVRGRQQELMEIMKKHMNKKP